MHGNKVLVLHTGGTIGMEKNAAEVYVTSPGKLLNYLISNPNFFYDSVSKSLVLSENGILIVLVEYVPLLDSSNVSSDLWIKIAKDIREYYEFYDGFVILHGTDTLAYTASALSFMLEGLQKPVILTGSQIPIYENRSDGPNNLLSSILLAGGYRIPEVCVFFDNKLLRGNRAIKNSSKQFDAFESPNYPPLAQVGIHITLYETNIREYKAPFRVHLNVNENVNVVKIQPTLSPSMLETILLFPYKGLVIESYGAGNIPTALLDILSKCVHSGCLVVNVTQCTRGALTASYETGKALESIGVISGNDMTTEAALTKLCFILALRHLTNQERIEMFKNDIRGEITPNDPYGN